MNHVVVLIVYVLTCCVMQSEAAKAIYPPCCRNSISTAACQRLQANNPLSFAAKCNTEADFRLIQCCKQCEEDGNVQLKYDAVARNLTQAACFDRMSSAYCAKFVNSEDAWTSGTWDCLGSQSALAFRICRLSCGYCSEEGSKILATLTAENFVYSKAMTQCTGPGNSNNGS